MSAILAAALALLAAGHPAETLWWVFLTRGPNRTQAPGPELDAMQAEHIANLERLWREGKAPLAGPLGDDGPIRGIVVVKAGSKEELIASFAPDPFVRIGRLAVEAYPWSGRAQAFHAPKEPIKLVQATLVILKKGPRWAADARGVVASHAAHLVRLEGDGELAASGSLSDGGDRLEALLFRSADARKVESLLGADSAVRAGHLAVELHPQYLADGILGEASPP